MTTPTPAEHLCEQAPRMLQSVGIVALAKGIQLFAQLSVGKSHPSRKTRPNSVGHFRGARLREGQAQDAFGTSSVKQQPEDPAGKNLRLAGPGRC